MKRRKWLLIALPLALLAACVGAAQPDQGEQDGWAALGRLRASYPMRSIPGFGEEEENDPFALQRATFIFFPAGEDTRQYHLNHGFPSTLACVSLKNGRFVKEWAIQLTKHPSLSRFEEMGTLEAHMARYRLYVRGDCPSKASKALSARKAFAGYQHHPIGSLICFWMTPDGADNRDSSKYWLEEPVKVYGITDEEKRWVRDHPRLAGHPDEPLPFTFMKGARLTDFLIEGGYTYATYRITRSILNVRAQADAELDPKAWEKFDDKTHGAGADDRIFFLRANNYRDQIRIMRGEGGGTTIIVQLKTRPQDQIRLKRWTAGGQ